MLQCAKYYVRCRQEVGLPSVIGKELSMSHEPDTGQYHQDFSHKASADSTNDRLMGIRPIIERKEAVNDWKR